MSCIANAIAELVCAIYRAMAKARIVSPSQEIGRIRGECLPGVSQQSVG